MLSFADFRLDDLRDINVIVGPNNSGKTNLLRAVETLRDFVLPPPGIYNSRDYALLSGDSLNQAYELRVGVDFGPRGVAIIRRFLLAYFKTYPFQVNNLFAANLVKTVRPGISSASAFGTHDALGTVKGFVETDLGEALAGALAQSVSRGTVVMEYEGDPGRSPSVRYDFQVDEETKASMSLYGAGGIISDTGVPSQEVPKILEVADVPVPGFAVGDPSATDWPTRESLKAGFDANKFISGMLKKRSFTSISFEPNKGPGFAKFYGEISDICLSAGFEYQRGYDIHLGSLLFYLFHAGKQLAESKLASPLLHHIFIVLRKDHL